MKMQNPLLDDLGIKFDTKIPAGFGLRLGAALIDLIPITIIVTGLGYLILGDSALGATTVKIGGVEYIEPSRWPNVLRTIGTLIWIAYCIHFETSDMQGTYGKKIMGIKVVNAEGEKMTKAQAIDRNFFKLLSGLIICLGYLWSLFHEKKRTWHDIIADVDVVKAN